MQRQGREERKRPAGGPVRPRLLPLAAASLLLSSAVGPDSSGSGRVTWYAQATGFASPSAFVARQLHRSRDAHSACAQTSTARRRIITHVLTTPGNADEDDTFFFKASQLAAQERQQQLKDGGAPLAISLSSLSTASDDTAVGADGDEGEGEAELELLRTAEEGTKVKNVGGGRSIESSVAKVDAEKSEQAKAPSDEIRVPVDPRSKLDEVRASSIVADDGDESNQPQPPPEGYDVSLGRSVDGGTFVVKEPSEETEDSAPSTEGPAAGDAASGDDGDEEEGADNAEAVLEDETDVAVEEKTVEESPDETEKTLDEPTASTGEGGEEPSDATGGGGVGYEEPLQSQPEIKIPIDPFQERQRRQQEVEAAKSEPEQSDETPLDTKSEVSKPPEPQPATSTHDVAKLSSDGKEVFEPSQSALEMNQENVDMGLLVLTRSFLTLKSILDKEDGE